jgi:predicted SnoaL-like aldol condensation-catalyzing enzyme
MSSEQNKALARRFIEEIWNQKNLAVAKELIADTYVFHTPGSPPGLPPGPEGF